MRTASLNPRSQSAGSWRLNRRRSLRCVATCRNFLSTAAATGADFARASLRRVSPGPVCRRVMVTARLWMAMFPPALTLATASAVVFWSAAMKSTLRTARAAWSAVRCRKGLRFAFAKVAPLLLLSGCGGEAFSLTTVDGGFVLGADVVEDAEGSQTAIEATCGAGAGGESCPPEQPRCLPSASGGFACLAEGSIGIGERCASGGVDDCALGAICVKSDETAGWRCRALCEPSRPCSSGLCTPLGIRGVSACLPVSE